MTTTVECSAGMKPQSKSSESMASMSTACTEPVEENFSMSRPRRRSITGLLVNCNEILPNLYLGGATAAQNTQHLVDAGIRAVVCCMREQEFPESDFHKDLEYYRIDVEDISREPIELFWPEATEFIHGFVSRGDPVLVHCRAGVSRSASTMIAYLVACQDYSLHDAFFHTRRRRPVVTPNLGFMEKLCDFEVEMRHCSSTTINFENYKSWYSGDTLAEEPKLRISSGTTPPDSPRKLMAVCSSNGIIESTDEHPSCQMPVDRSITEGRSASKLKFQAAARKVVATHWLKNRIAEKEIELDLPPVGELKKVAGERISGIKTLLLRYAAQDSELAYCQGMHLTASIFMAGCFSKGGSYFRFQAFIRSVRGLWMPGFPLLETGLVHFAEVAKTTEWYKHFQEHDVDASLCLSKVWLTMFTTWVPLLTLVECLEFLEGHGFSGMLAMTLALIDEAAEDLLEEDDEEGILTVLDEFEEREVEVKSLLQAMQRWLPITDDAVSKPVDKVADVPCKRRGSRVVDEHDEIVLTNLPHMPTWILCKEAETAEAHKSRSARRLSWSGELM